MAGRRAIIIGAGPAGLTAALELLKRSDLVPTVLDRGSEVGGLASTRVHRGNRIDLGGHRFFTKSDRVLDWWLDLLPLEPGASLDGLAYRGQLHAFDRVAPAVDDRERTVSDALKKLRSTQGAINCRACICDADGDGAVDSTDALAVLKAALRDLTGLACNAC